MSNIPICVMRPRMGRKLRYPDKIIAPLPAGSLVRIVAVLTNEEDKTDFLREAVERELKRREAAVEAELRLRPKPHPDE